MNKMYKVIYDKGKQLYVVVSEIAGGFTKSVSNRKRFHKATLVSLALVAGLGFLPSPAMAVTLEQQVATNTTNISTNASHIATNTTNIASNKAAINQNKADIAANKTAINTNKTNIAANKSAIDQNKTDIAANKAAIEQNKNNIEANKTAINTNTSNITTNTNNIADLANSLGLEVGSDGTITGQSSLSKYFKAKSSTSSYTETITNPDGTTTTVTTNLTDTDAKANGDNSVAIGPNAVSNGKQSVALGDGAVTKGTANRGIAIGQGAITGVTADMPADQGSDISTSSGGIDSISIGTDSNSRGNDAISIGHNAVVQNIPIDGSGTEVSSGSIAIGSDAKVYGSNNSLAFGTGASVAADNVNGNTADEAIAIGYNAAVKQNATRAIAIGSESVADKALAIAIGYKSTSAKNSLALGNEANAAEKGLAIGNAAQSKSADAQAFGNGAVANSVGDISIGNQAGVGSDEKRANVDGALIAIGTKAGQNVIGTANVAVGNNAGSNVHSNYNVAVGSEAGQGFQTEASTDNPQNGYNVSIGYKANDFSSDTASSSIQYATAIGAEAKAYSNGTAIGRASLANGDYTVALGENAAAYDGSSIAFGANSTAKLGNIAIGSGSDATSAISGTGYLTNQATPTSYISVGKSDNLRRISNVADGSADNDVVTVRQLKTAVSQFSSGSSGTTGGVTQDYVDQQISNLTESINSLSKKYFSVSSNPDTNVNNADNNGASANNKNAMAIGPGVAVEADDAVAVGNNTKATGAGSIAIGSEGPVSADDTGDSSHITEANGERSVSIGSGAVAQTDHSIAIGTRATNYNQVNEDNESSTQGNKSIAIGYYAETAGNSAVATGDNAVAAADNSVAIGKGAGTLASATDSIAVGTSTQVAGKESTVVGSYNTVIGDRTHTFGTGNTMTKTGTGSVNPVYESGVVGNDNTINVVNNNQDDHVGSVTDAHMVGNKNTVDQANEGFIIKDLQISGSSNTVQGASTTAAEAGSLTGVTIDGFGNTVKGRNIDSPLNDTENINIVGNNNTVDVNNAGNGSNLSNVQILGSNVNATVGNSAYIGSGSAAKKTADNTTSGVGSYVGETYKNRGGDAVTFAGSTSTGVVTVGSSGNERRVQNVAAGRVGAGSTDAINGSQLYYATRDHHYLGDNSDLAADRNVVNVGSDGHINVVGQTTDINGNRVTRAEDLRNQLTDGNIGVMADSGSNTMVVKLNKDVVLGSTTQDGSLTLKNNNGTETAKLTATAASSNLDGSATINRAALSGTSNTASIHLLDSTEDSYAVATMSDGLSFVGDDGTPL
jgi:trimeric autotransporter adhesin